MVELPLYFQKRLQADEEIVAFVRPFGLVYFWWFFLGVVLLLGAFYYLFFFLQMGLLGKLILLGLVLLGVFVLLKTIIVWRFTAVVITNKRIIDFDQKGIFAREISEAPFANIQDISLQQNGFWAVALKFGTIKIQTAGSQNVLELEHVRYPRDLHDLLVELHQNYHNQTKSQVNSPDIAADPAVQEFIKIIEQAKEEVGEERVKKALNQWLASNKNDQKEK